MSKETQIKLIKTLKGAFIAGSGVALTYLLEALTQMDFGSYTAIVAGMSSILINAFREYLKTYNE